MLIDSYFKGEKFFAVKARVEQHIAECNDLNAHIEHLKLSYSYAESFDYGEGQLSDNSRYKMQRRQWATASNNRWTHQCSASIVKNANDQPYKYLCKYFNISPDESTLEQFEEVLNDFSAVEQGKFLLANERDAILLSASTSISPYILKNYRDRVTKELGFKNISLSNLYFPVYTFQYVSAGGNSSSKFDLTFDIAQIERFISYLAGLVKFKNSIAGQRALMTSKLREHIKVRDGYACQICSLSTEDEKNLLLEIDHIIPLSKGGVTCESNLQTLCWKCNRSKGSKIYSTDVLPSPVSNSPAKSDMTRPPKTSAPTASAKSDMTRPPKASVPTASAKSDMTRPPKASAPTASAKLDMTRPPKASVPTASAKLDMTRPPKASVPTASAKSDMTRPPKASVPNASAKSDMTRPQANALRSAKDYLEYSGYSRKGLIEQLHECDDYIVSDATIAVDSLNVDWKEQAVKSAKDYLEYSGYSRKGLIEQLHECDDYIVSDATVAVDSLNIDWKEQAVKSAKDYLEYSGYSCKGLIEQLHECDDYSLNEATYGAEQAGACS
uniref:Ltp family lipoprotein n=1 Tax=Psychrobacter sp. TaxID=56811 RepID=UPI0015EFDAAA|nr:Ltp family lipoprotein [Psychrobacter sp.]